MTNRRYLFILLLSMLLVAILTTLALRLICDKKLTETYYGQQVDLRLRGLK
jgi:hypothetical protein